MYVFAYLGLPGLTFEVERGLGTKALVGLVLLGGEGNSEPV